MNKIPTISEILSINPLDAEKKEYEGCKIFSLIDLRICVEFPDPGHFLNSLWNRSTPDETDVRLILWKDQEGGLVKARAVARYRHYLINKIPTNSLKTLNKEQFVSFLQNYPNLMEWYLFNPFDILTE